MSYEHCENTERGEWISISLLSMIFHLVNLENEFTSHNQSFKIYKCKDEKWKQIFLIRNTHEKSSIIYNHLWVQRPSVRTNLQKLEALTSQEYEETNYL